jgi:hypothetical protein
VSDRRLSRSRALLPAVILGLVTTLGTINAAAAGTDEERAAAPVKYSVTPFLGYRFGGKFDVADNGTDADARSHVSFAVAFDLALEEETQYELFYSRERTSLGASAPAPSDTVIEYLHLGGTLLVGALPRYQPYIIGTLGATRFSPDSSAGTDRIYFSVSLGAGVRIPLKEHLAVRLEARGYATFFSSNTSVFCRSDQTGGVCQIHGSGSTFFQGDILAGLAYTF